MDRIHPIDDRPAAIRKGRGTRGAFSRMRFSMCRNSSYPTKTGAVMVGLSIAIGIAAYNTSNNILYIALALFLASLLSSGVLSGVNFSRLSWRASIPPRMRVGSEALPGVRIRNSKRGIPSFAIWFHMEARNEGRKLRISAPVTIPAGSVECVATHSYVPSKRGVETFSVVRIESSFPFGFLNKLVRCDPSVEESIIWPARVPYHFDESGSGTDRADMPERLRRSGGWELMGLRDYRHGDPVRQVHWKASAKMRRLLVRETADEDGASLAVWVDASTSIWKNTAQRERMIGAAAAVAEDLYHEGMLAWVGVAGGAGFSARMRSNGDLCSFLDALACMPDEQTGGEIPLSRRNTISFRPSGDGALAILMDGREVGDA